MPDDAIDVQDPERVEHTQRWLQHAPSPPNRPEDQYDAFISYRSSDRAWAMALYDVMKMAEWNPFLDQYDLIPGRPLSTSLEEALEVSSSGVILWSSRTKDSDWCRKERDAMDHLRGHKDGFNFIFAKLDQEDLPLFARTNLYEDFSGTPEGPRGYGLLRLMWGLTGEQLPEEAVQLAQEVDESTRQVLVKIRAAVEAENPDRLVELGASRDLGFLASPGPVQEAALGLISMKCYEEALQVLERAQSHFPKAIRLRQLKGLALRRLERYQEAVEVLSELYVEGHRDPETMGILAAAWDGRFRETGKQLYLRKSRDLYKTAFAGNPDNYYTGINAAAKSLFLGEAEEARLLAEQVLTLVKDAADGEDFWATCTLADAHLLRRELEAAAHVYQIVADRYFARSGDLASTRQQAERICEAHGLTTEETAIVLKPLLDL